MGCNCKQKPEPIPVEVTPPVIEELSFPDTPDGLLAKELKEYNDEKYRKLMEDINKVQPE